MRLRDIRQAVVEDLTAHGWTPRLALEVVNWRIAYAQRMRKDVTKFLTDGVYLGFAK